MKIFLNWGIDQEKVKVSHCHLAVKYEVTLQVLIKPLNNLFLSTTASALFCFPIVVVFSWAEGCIRTTMLKFAYICSTASFGSQQP